MTKNVNIKENRSHLDTDISNLRHDNSQIDQRLNKEQTRHSPPHTASASPRFVGSVARDTKNDHK